ncbi:MAG: CHAT domain-containing protein, partial [Gammaproteobacteria bacterium]|nr:CHAT domain-containing protein [Gammaproteobacteria bacterium]
MFLGRVGEIFILPAARHEIRADLVIFAGMGDFAKFTPAVSEKVAENVARTLVRARVDDFAIILFGATRITSEKKSAAAKRKAFDAVLGHVVEGFFQGVRNSRKSNPLRNPLRAITICDTNADRCDEIEAALVRFYKKREDVVEMTLDRITLPEPLRKEAKTGPRPVVLQATQERGRSERSITLRLSLLPTVSTATGLTRDKSVSIKSFEEIVTYVNKADDDKEKGFIYNTLRPKRGRAYGRKGRGFEDALQEYGDWMGKKLVPTDIRTALKKMAKDRRIVVTHDVGMSRVPWETLCINRWFPAADGGMSRQYFTNDMPMTNWLEERRLGDTLDVLLIVNPTRDLEGADEEGKLIESVARQLPGVKLTTLKRSQATKKKVKAELESGQYDVLHYAGHTNFDPTDASWSGILCSGKNILSGNDLREMKNLPALVFFNSCQSGRVGGLTQKAATATERNIGLAEAFLRGGVANYVGTHWWVGDEAAPFFMKEFYGALLQGESIGTAVSNGRQAVRHQAKSLDWADFIHYGNPDFVLKFKKR